jgi:putative membrane protein
VTSADGRHVVRPSRLQWAELLIVAVVFVWSAIGAVQPKVWFMETVPVWVGGIALAWRWRAFPWTELATALMALFAIVLCVGGHYTYSLVPLGNWMRTQFALDRNPYDRIGHVLQGVVPGLLARELLLRRTPLRPGKATFWIVASVALAMSALFELAEWQTAIRAAPEAGIAYLGAQGDVWDAQWDMTSALGGVLVMQLAFARLHDRQLARLDRRLAGE